MQQRQINLSLFRKIPTDIIINHILPFTQQPQSREHLENIRGFITDIRIIYNYYNDNEHIIMINKLLQFCNITISVKLLLVTNQRFCYRRNITHFRFLWGRLTPKERSRFINNFILE